MLVLAAVPFIVACAISRAAAPDPTPTVAPTSTATTATTVPTDTATPNPTPTATPVPALTATQQPLISEVAPAVRPPAASRPAPAANLTPVPGGQYLPVPDGTTVVWGGCASDGTCYSYNFYWAPTHEVVMQLGEQELKVQHERCHAHQHLSINGGAPLHPSDFDLEPWYATSEGSSFTSVVAGLDWPWTHSAVNGLEDFAWACAYWYLDPARLLNVSPERYRWASDNLP